MELSRTASWRRRLGLQEGVPPLHQRAALAYGEARARSRNGVGKEVSPPQLSDMTNMTNSFTKQGYAASQGVLLAVPRAALRTDTSIAVQ